MIAAVSLTKHLKQSLIRFTLGLDPDPALLEAVEEVEEEEERLEPPRLEAGDPATPVGPRTHKGLLELQE